MTDLINLPQNTITIPLTQRTRQIADSFSQGQPTEEKVTQVRLNILAVLAVRDYLDMMGIETDLSGSYSWNPVGRLMADIADIRLPGRGHLECRPLPPGDLHCQIPLEVWEDRIGYVVVRIDEAHREATLLGFVSTVQQSLLSLRQLQPLDNLLEHLHQPFPVITRLGQWLNQLFEVGWESVEGMLTSSQSELAVQFRGTPRAETGTGANSPEELVRRGKVFDLGVQLERRQIALVVEISPLREETVSILLQVHPIGDSILPSGLSLAILDDAGTIFREIQAREADNCIQLRVNGSFGENFAVRIALGEASLTERFVI